MTRRDSELTKLDNLIDQYCAGVLDEPGFEQLQTYLQQSSEYRRRFLDIVSIHADLHDLADAGTSHDAFSELLPESAAPSPIVAPTLPPVSTPINNIIPLSILAFIAVFSSVVFALTVWQQNTELARNQPQEVSDPNQSPAVASVPAQKDPQLEVVQVKHDTLLETPGALYPRLNRSIAMIRDAVDAKWASTQPAIRVGDQIDARTLKLDEGIAEIAFLNGATVILEGPAELELISGLRGILHFGKVRCFVPPTAKGFVVDSGSTRYLDLGTEFGLEVESDGRQELHVFDGEVEVQSLQGNVSPKLIVSGNGLRRPSDSGPWTPLSSDSTRFASTENLLDLKLKYDERRYAAWRSHVNELRSHPDLVLLYDFEPESDKRGQLLNRSDDHLHGTILGAEWSTGRWSTKSALDFKRPNDRVRLDVPGTYENVSMTAWLRVEGFDRQFNSIMLSDAFEAGNLHWQIQSTGKLDVGFKPPDGAHRRVYLSPQVLGYEDLGRWIHLAFVFDQASGKVSHYLDGEVVSRHDIYRNLDSDPAEHVSTTPHTGLPEEKLQLQFGPCDLGNWSPVQQYDDWPIRNFNGLIDEFAMFRRALGDDEIKALFDAGSTY